MRVITRSGLIEEAQFSKIQQRLKDLHHTLFSRSPIQVDEIARDTINEVHDMISTSDLDEHSARIAAGKGIDHPDYLRFAGAICASNLMKETKQRPFSQTMEAVRGMLDPTFAAYCSENADALDGFIVDSRDYQFDYQGIRTLMRSYLLHDKGVIVERPQHLWMRVAVALYMGDLTRIQFTYDLLSQGYYTHATPTLFNAGTRRQQMASCFLGGMDDSISAIYKWLSDCASISKWAGGLGMHVHNIRATGSAIQGTNGTSNGLIPMLQVFNATARYVDQGGGKRKGSIAVYLEPWHADILDFLELRTNTGDENKKARDLFLALWIPDLFMKRVVEDGPWSLMCPSECPGLSDLYGSEFEELYVRYEAEGRCKRVVQARELFRKVMESQIETGVPYMCYKDSVNRKSNQKNVGIIRSSNLCSEIMEYSDSKEYAVCNLASINLSRMVEEGGSFDFAKLRRVAYEVTCNLDRVIDLNFYPCPETEMSNQRHRPVGLGVQGLVDVFFKLRHPFDSEEARALNRQIFETIYLGAAEASADLAEQKGPYPTFAGSPVSQGDFQFDLWGVEPHHYKPEWEALRERVRTHGIRNSLLTAVMPTASTSQILGNYECIEPPNSNIYTRRTIAGTFTVINKYLVRDLQSLRLWSTEMRDRIIKDDGSIQAIEHIPHPIRMRYKTVWEIPQKAIIDMSVDRAPFIDQSQSLNLFMAKPDFNRLFNMHVYGWKNGLKTGMYYLRSRPASNPIKFSLGATTTQEEGECLSCAA